MGLYSGGLIIGGIFASEIIFGRAYFSSFFFGGGGGGLLSEFYGMFALLHHRPTQHGAELLSLLSKLLDQNTKPEETGNHSSALVVSLALQALEQLCKAEVIILFKQKLYSLRCSCR